MVKGRIFLICRDGKCIDMAETPEEALKKARKEGAQAILQCFVEALIENIDKYDWAQSLEVVQ